jgi:hypothetical protein
VLKFKRVLIAGALAFVMGSAQAALIDRGGGLLYDNVLNVTWLQDANFAKTSGYDADGRMFWQEASAWASNLSYYDSVRNATYSDWRLPNTSAVSGGAFNYAWSLDGSSDYGYNISASGSLYAGSTGSEMAHLYYTSLGYVAGQAVTNAGPFSNFQADYYWSATPFAPSMVSGYAFDFSFYHGGQGGYNYFGMYGEGIYALAVREGDVAASPIPEPETYALMLTGLGLLGLTVRRRQ